MFFIPLIPLAIPYALSNLAKLRDFLFPPAPATTPASSDYVPPFTGGQCPVNYIIQIRAVQRSDGADVLRDTRSVAAPITSIVESVNTDANEHRLLVQGTNSSIQTAASFTTFSRLYAVIVGRSDGQPDNCGDLPDPNPAPSPSSDGIAQSAPPDIETNGEDVVLGSPLVAIPSFAAALASALAAAKNALDVLAAVKSIADAISSISDLLNKIKDFLDGMDKDNPEKKDIVRLELGSIRKDGFLRLYPTDNSQKYRAEQLDITCLSIPFGYGKYFGSLSPHFYRFKSLGYIAFVSPTFGILEYREIEFSRMSLDIPENAIGFFYHLGLEDEIVANATTFYTRPQEVTTQ